MTTITIHTLELLSSSNCRPPDDLQLVAKVLTDDNVIIESKPSAMSTRNTWTFVVKSDLPPDCPSLDIEIGATSESLQKGFRLQSVHLNTSDIVAKADDKQRFLLCLDVNSVDDVLSFHLRADFSIGSIQTGNIGAGFPFDDRMIASTPLDDIHKSVSVLEEAVRLTPEGHPDRPSGLNNLGGSLLRRFERLADPNDIDKSISVFEEAVRLTPDRHPDKPSFLRNLNNSLLRRFQCLRDPSDMNTSVSVEKEAVRPPDEPIFRSQKMTEQGLQAREAAHPSRSISDPRNISSSVYLGAPIHLMGLLTEKKAYIEAVFCNTGIHHHDLCFSAGFDEEVFANGGMFIQQAYFVSHADFVADEAHVVAALDELGKTLSPYSVVVSTPSRQYYSPTYLSSSGRCTYNEYISFHAKQKDIPDVHHKLVTTALSPMMMGTGRRGDDRRNGNDKKDEESSGPGDEAKREGAPDETGNEDSPGGDSDDAEENHGLQQVETNNNNESSTSTSNHRLASGSPDNDPVEQPDAKNVIHFEVAFNIRHIDRGDQEKFNQSIRVEGTLQSEEIAEALLADVISSSHIRFSELAFYGNAGKTRVDEHYRQSDTEVKIDLGKGQGRFHLFDVNPRSTPKLGVERKELDTEERTRQLLTGISANVSFPWKPTFGGTCNFTIGQKGARTMESSVKVNRIIHTKTDQDTTWRYSIGDEWTQENGVCLPPNFDPPSAKFSFLGKPNYRKPQKLKVGIKSSWVMPDCGVRDAYTRFGRNTPVLRGLATQITFDIPPHMNAGWTVFHELNVTIVPRDNGYGVKSEMDIPKDFHASLVFREA